MVTCNGGAVHSGLSPCARSDAGAAPQGWCWSRCRRARGRSCPSRRRSRPTRSASGRRGPARLPGGRRALAQQRRSEGVCCSRATRRDQPERDKCLGLHLPCSHACTQPHPHASTSWERMPRRIVSKPYRTQGGSARLCTRSLTWGGPTQAFSAFTNDVIWLIVVSFFFAAVRSLSVLHASVSGVRRSETQ